MARRNSSRYGYTTASITPGISKMPFATYAVGTTLESVYGMLVPSYRSAVYPHLILRLSQPGDIAEVASAVRGISQKRYANRIQNYIILTEIERAYERLEGTKDSASIRFGNKKEGRGYHGARGDFCLTSGAVDGRHLTLFYRSLELIGGLAYDLGIIKYLGNAFEREWKSITIHAARANVFALKGNSNEKLYPQFRRILGL